MERIPLTLRWGFFFQAGYPLVEPPNALFERSHGPDKSAERNLEERARSAGGVSMFRR